MNTRRSSSIGSRRRTASSSLVFFGVLLSAVAVVNGQLPDVTTTTTETRTVTDVITVTSNYICAKLVNVTGPCRRRRGFQLEDPIILTFDEDLNDSIDEVLGGRSPPPEWPTRTLSVESTPLATLNDRTGVNDSPITPISSEVIESSLRSKRGAFSRNDGPTPRIYFAQINAFVNYLYSQVFGLRSTVTVTVTNVETTTSIKTTGTSKSFFVQRCTPSPFPYPVCSSRRR